jgi:plasmid maintenance system antidote protein VapI
MTKELEKYKGLHPGAILDRLLKKRKISQRPFALSLPEHPQTLNAITKGKRDLNTPLSLKIEKALDLEEGTLMTLQVYYDIQMEKKKTSAKSPELNNLRKTLFWDTDIHKIDWEMHYKYVIRRVFERGNEEEKKELIRFYGQDKIDEAIQNLPAFMSHLNKH